MQIGIVKTPDFAEPVSAADQPILGFPRDAVIRQMRAGDVRPMTNFENRHQSGRLPPKTGIRADPVDGSLKNDAKLPHTFFTVSLGCKSSPKVQRTSGYQSKVEFLNTLDPSPEVVGSRRKPNRVPRLFR